MTRRKKKKHFWLAGLALEVSTIIGLIGLAQPGWIAQAFQQADDLVNQIRQNESSSLVYPTVHTPAVGHIRDPFPAAHELTNDVLLPPVLDSHEWLPQYFDIAIVH